MLGLAQRRGRRFTGKGVALRRTRAFTARLPHQRSDKSESAARSRAVVRGDPERQLDERRRQFLDDALHRCGLDALGRRNADLCDDTAPPRVPEAHLDHRARPDAVGHLVGELTRERAGGDERIDGRERHRASVVGTVVGARRRT